MVIIIAGRWKEKRNEKKRKERKGRRAGKDCGLRSGDQILEEAEEIPLFPSSALAGSFCSWRDGHWTDDVLVSHLGELVVVVKTGDADIFAWVDVRLGQGEGDTV